MKFSRTVGLALSLSLLSTDATAQTQHRGFTVGDEMSSSDIAALGETGANIARFWCRPQNLTATESETQFYNRVDHCLDTLDTRLGLYEAAGIQVVLAIDPPTPLYVPTTGLQEHSVFHSANAQAWFIQAWNDVAEHYVGESSILGFDILNEPAVPNVLESGIKNWETLASDIIAVIRDAGATQRIYVESRYGNPTKIAEVGRICEAAKLNGRTGIYGSFHFYNPFPYTHQGLSGNRTGIRVPNKKARTKLERNFVKARTTTGMCDGIYVGEIGVSRFASGRETYFSWIIKYFAARGWDWSVHAFREADSWSVEHNASGSFVGDTAPMKVLKSYFARQ